MALIHSHFYSDALEMQWTFDALIPQGPRLPREGWRTLYLLHGLSDDHTTWQRRTSIERYVAPLDLAVIMPAVGRSFYTDMASGPRYWEFVSEELPEMARSLFHLSAARERNYVAGNSMGGYGAFKLALLKPEKFAAAASLSGAMDIVRWARKGLQTGPEAESIFGDLARLEGGDNDLFALASRQAPNWKELPALYHWCGVEDFLYAENLRFRDHARNLGLNLEYEEGPGSHEWAAWDLQIQRVLQWLPL